MDQYSVFFNNTDIGIASVTKEGLYYLIDCRCKIVKEGIYRLIASNGENNIDIGVLAPKESCFEIHRKISIKRLGAGKFTFSVVVKGENLPQPGCFVPFETGKPFTRLQDIDRARFVCMEGIPGLFIQ